MRTTCRGVAVLKKRGKRTASSTHRHDLPKSWRVSRSPVRFPYHATASHQKSSQPLVCVSTITVCESRSIRSHATRRRPGADEISLTRRSSVLVSQWSSRTHGQTMAKHASSAMASWTFPLLCSRPIRRSTVARRESHRALRSPLRPCSGPRWCCRRHRRRHRVQAASRHTDPGGIACGSLLGNGRHARRCRREFLHPWRARQHRRLDQEIFS
jgi:hypothetical protein